MIQRVRIQDGSDADPTAGARRVLEIAGLLDKYAQRPADD